MKKGNNIMNHVDVLNEMLANNCPSDNLSSDIRTFYFEGHCVEYKITAKLLSIVPTITYEIISFEMN